MLKRYNEQLNFFKGTQWTAKQRRLMSAQDYTEISDQIAFPNSASAIARRQQEAAAAFGRSVDNHIQSFYNSLLLTRATYDLVNGAPLAKRSGKTMVFKRYENLPTWKWTSPWVSMPKFVKGSLGKLKWELAKPGQVIEYKNTPVFTPIKPYGDCILYEPSPTRRKLVFSKPTWRDRMFGRSKQRQIDDLCKIVEEQMEQIDQLKRRVGDGIVRTGLSYWDYSVEDHGTSLKNLRRDLDLLLKKHGLCVRKVDKKEEHHVLATCKKRRK